MAPDASICSSSRLAISLRGVSDLPETFASEDQNVDTLLLLLLFLSTNWLLLELS